MTIFLAVICAILMLAGLAGIVLPVLPGIQLAWLGLLIYAWGTGFERVSLVATLVFLALVVASMILDYAAQVIGAKKFKASKYGLFGAFIGSALGIIIFGFWGIVLGPVLGALLGELLARRGFKQAFTSAGGTVVGCIAGNLYKAALILVMMGFFIASLF